MTYEKITPGYVVQSFNDQGKCVAQVFVVEVDVAYECAGSEINSEDMPLGGREYHPFEMVKP